MLTIPQLTEKMIAFSAGNTADIHHFLCVWAYAKTIGEAEGLDEKTLFLLEATAIIHDISCPLCREKYGNTARESDERFFVRKRCKTVRILCVFQGMGDAFLVKKNRPNPQTHLCGAAISSSVPRWEGADLTFGETFPS